MIKCEKEKNKKVFWGLEVVFITKYICFDYKKISFN